MNINSIDSIISLDHVRCTYRIKQGLLRFKPYHAIQDVSFTVIEGETLGIIGRNGAGKSTILKLIAGILRPDAGRVIKRSEINISLLSLQVGFDRELSGRENILLGGLCLGITQKRIMECMNGIITFSDLGAFIENPIKTYSSGMRARLGFSIGLELMPDVLLIDEVLGVGDWSFKKKASEALRSKIRSGKTVILVSHDLDQVKNICDRVVWIENGMTRCIGNPVEIIDFYKNCSPRV
jgi:lipopolysaccharide transport system ATP-binding protein